MTCHDMPTTTHAQRGDGGNFLYGLLAGAAVGGGLALLFAPREGADMRHGLATGAQQASRRLTEAYGTVAGTARRSARRLVEQAGRRKDALGDTDLAFTSGQLRDRAADAAQVLRDAVGEARYEPAAVEPSETGPGATSPARSDSRSPLV